MECVGVCWSVMECVAVPECLSVSMLQCVAVCCSVLQCVALTLSHAHPTFFTAHCTMTVWVLQVAAVCCSVLQCVAA